MILITEGLNQYYLIGSMMENTTRSNILTQYPTVEGTSFSDHYYREPDSVSFRLKASAISKSLIYTSQENELGQRTERWLSQKEVEALVMRWFSTAARLFITTLRMNFDNQVMTSYSWSDQDLSLFSPTLSFKEARVQSLRVATILNPDQYYQAAFGQSVAVGGSAPMQDQINWGSALVAGATGAAIGAMVAGPWGAVIGGAIGFFGALL